MTEERPNEIINDKKEGLKAFVYQTLLCVLSPAGVLIISYLLKKPLAELVRNVILMFMCCGLIILSVQFRRQKDGMRQNGQNLLGRFCIFFLFGFVLIGTASYIPATCWPFLPFAVALSLLSNPATGIISYITLVMMSYYMAGVTVNYLLLYIFVGMIGMVLFQNLGVKYRYEIPLLCSILLSFAAQTAMTILLEPVALTLDLFVYPMINVFASTVMLLLFLKYYSYRIVHRYRDDYLRLNDPEYALLVEQKQFSNEEYYHAIHTAYFCDKLAKKIGADASLAKAGGYYHKIGKMRGENNLVQSLQIGEEHKFPPDLMELLREYGSKHTKLHSKEAAIVLLADSVVSSVMFLFAKDKNATLDYEQIVAVVFQKKLERNAFKDCDLTLQELATLKKTFVEEKLYYDFLR